MYYLPLLLEKICFQYLDEKGYDVRTSLHHVTQGNERGDLVKRKIVDDMYHVFKNKTTIYSYRLVPMG